MKYKIVALLSLLLIFTGCSAKLSEKKQTFSDQGISYSIQLPSSWEKEKDPKEGYGQKAIFAAKDKKSNSTMFVSTTRKETVDLKDFGKKTREQLAKTYNYENAEDIYMKEFKLKDYQAYKYTAFTKFKDKDVWAHLYYIETKTGFVQLAYYSADDNDYEARSKIIDQSARSLQETKVDTTYKAEKEDNDTELENDSVIVKNNDVSFDIKGFRKIAGQENQTLLIVGYETKNLTDQKVTADLLKEVVTVTQKGQLLKEMELPKSEENSALDVLVKHQKDLLEKDQSVETAAIYELNQITGEVVLTFDSEKFPEQDPVILDLSLLN